MKIGFIGLGNMGSPMCKNLIDAGHELSVYDLQKQFISRMAELGATPMESAGEVAKYSKVVFTSLPNPKIVTDVYLEPGGIVESAEPGTILIDLSTVTPQTVKNIYEKAKEKNIELLDAPVSGGVKGAQSGSLSIMVGGNANTFERVKNILNILGKKINYLGEIGSGQAIKLVNQFLFGINIVAMSEALVLGTKAGISPEKLYEILNISSANSYALETRFSNFILKGDFNPGFSIDLMSKDMGLAIQMGREINTPLIIGKIAEEIYKISQYLGTGSLDIAGIIKYYEKISGVEVREPLNKN